MTSPNIPPPSRTSAFADDLRRQVSIPRRVAHFVHELIASGELNPGDRVVESRLARGLGVGHPTIREALVALEHQGLVERRTNQGCFVTELTREQAVQILELRMTLETLAVELAAERGEPDQFDRLREIADEMAAAGAARDIEEFYRRDLDFHRTLWTAGGNPYMEKALAPLMLPLLAFCMLKNLRNREYLDMVRAAQAHHELADAVASRDKVRAGEAARQQFAVFARQHLSGFDVE